MTLFSGGAELHDPKVPRPACARTRPLLVQRPPRALLRTPPAMRTATPTGHAYSIRPAMPTQSHRPCPLNPT
eukprot:4325121-Prymnesium_polylepis.1